MFFISPSPIEVIAQQTSSEAGAVVIFEGVVRNHNEGRAVLSLEYEAMESLATKEGSRIIEEALEKFDVHSADCIHRVGHLQIGDIAVRVVVSASHRKDAFAACQYIIDEVKSRVPIWKKEHYENGSSAWIGSESWAKAAAP